MYDSAWLNLPTADKTKLLDLLSNDKSDVVIISTPSTTQAQLNAALTEAAGGVVISALKSTKLPVGTESVVEASGYAPHRALLPSLLSAHNDNTQGFSGVAGGGIVVSKVAAGPSVGTSTAVQWSLDGGSRIVTLLGYWRPGEKS